MKINVSNPDLITCQNEQLSILILGGIKISGLDRMRVTLKIEKKEGDQHPLRYNLDLYNQEQVSKLVEKVSVEHDQTHDYLKDLFNHLTNELEKYRFETLELLSGSNPDNEIHLTTSQKKEAITFLSQQDLMNITQANIGRSGVVGEEINRLLMYMVFTSRKTTNPLHLICFGQSGEGKTHLQETVGLLIPDEDKIEITALTKNALYYFQDKDLDRKVLLLEDIDGVESALFPLRELQSKRQLTKSLTVKDKRGRLQTIVHTVKGNVSIVGATTKESIYEDNSNRSILINLDTSEEQDQKIMQHQKDLYGGALNGSDINKVRTLFQNSQRILEPLNVVNPYASKLFFPNLVNKPRRALRIYLSLIETITYYHQYQRRKFKDEAGNYFINTKKEDIEWANYLLKESLLIGNDNLSSGCRKFYEQLSKQQSNFTSKDLKARFRMNHNTMKHYMKQLVQEGYLKIVSGTKHQGYTYQLMNEVPNEQHRNQLETLLKKQLKNL